VSDSSSPPVATSNAGRAPDVALAIAIGLALLGWLDGFLSTNALGLWWGLIWLGPVLYAARRLWTSRIRHARRWAWLPLLVYLALATFQLTLGRTRAWPWWLAHVALGASLFAFALRFRPSAAAAWFVPRLSVLTLVVLALPWIGTPEPHAFWQRCVRLRQGMRVAEVMALFGDGWVQQRDTQDGCARTPVSALRLEDWRDAKDITFYPIAGENCSADLCWTTFEDGRLVSYWPSPD